MTTPPLDLTVERLTALREQVRRAKSASCACHPMVALHHDEALALLDRAEAAEKKVAAVRESVGRYYVIDGHACDDLDEDCARCVADEVMDALDGGA